MKPERNDGETYSDFDMMVGTLIIIGTLIAGAAGGLAVAVKSGSIEAGGPVCIAGLIAFVVSGSAIGLKVMGKIK